MARYDEQNRRVVAGIVEIEDDGYFERDKVI